MEETKKSLGEYVDLRYITPEQSVFKLTAGGFLSLHIKPDEEYPRVHLYRTLPFTNDRIYISVRDKEGKEIGIIKTLDDFSPETVNLFQVDLQRRYFVPTITKIKSIKEEFGYTYWEVDTDAGAKRFTTKSGQNQVLLLVDDRLLVIDLDGNRFEIPDYRQLDIKNQRIIESLL